MKKWILGLALVLTFTVLSAAQTSSSSSGSTSGTSSQSGSMSGSSGMSKKAGKSSAAKESTLTGCLNGSGGSYSLTNGHYKKGVAVTPASGVDLAPHSGHEVRLTGTWEKGAAQKTFNATAMKHISDTCPAAGGKKAGKKGGMSESGGAMGSEPPKK